MRDESPSNRRESLERARSERGTVEDLVDAVVKHKLVTPAILALELFKPWSFVGSQFLLLLQPLLGLLSRDAGQYISLLEDREAIDRLLERLDRERAA
ncbi:MAG: hypothetical protein U9R48_06890 [Chloroflexota bacterium]|nr:hypothetical protein [Chloroflexota bacterium]